MSEHEIERYRRLLAQIAELASSAVDGSGYQDESEEHATDRNAIVCTPKYLPKRLWAKAAQTATKINPVNAPMAGHFAALADTMADPQLFITLVTSKYWGPTPRTLTVSFMENTPADLRARILSHMNAWTKTASIRFVETKGVAQVRISRGPGGYWSYLGTDILHIPQNRQTMNLEGFTMSTSESEFRRVVRHETGHTYGFAHEHMRKELVALIDPQKAYDYFLRTQGWNRTVVDQQVLTPLDGASIMGTPPDQTSIMCYQLPGSITRNGKPILGGTDINATDYDFAGKIYPKPGNVSTFGDIDAEEYEEDWEEAAAV